MTMTSASVRNSIWDWLSVAIMSAMPDITSENKDEKIVWSNQKDKPTTAPFVSLHLVQFDTDNATETRDTFNTDIDENPDQKIVENILYRGLGTVAINIYGADSLLNCFNVKAALREWPTIEAMQAAKLGLVGVGATQNVSALVETDFESRASFNLDFYFAFAKQIDKLSVGRVPLQGSIDLDAQVVDIEIDEPGFVPPP